MTYVSYNKLWVSEVDNIVFGKDKEQDINMNQIKLRAHDTYKKDEETTASSEPSNDEDAIKKAYLDEKMSRLDGHF